MLRVGRGRIREKDLPLGVYPVKARYYVRPVNDEMRRIFETLFEAGTIDSPKSIPMGADKDQMRKDWVKLFVTDVPQEEPEAGTVAELIARYRRDVIAKMPDGDAKKTHSRQCDVLAAAFGDRHYAKSEPEAATGKFLRTMDLTRWLRAEATREYSITSKKGKVRTFNGRPVGSNRIVKRLSRIFKLAKTEWGYTEYNPCLQLEYNPEFARDAYQDDAMFMRLYQKASVVMQCLMDLAQMNGARRGMLLRIMLADADLAKPHLRLTLNKRRHGRKPKYRHAPWTDDMREVIKRALAHRATVRGGQKEVIDLETAPLFLSRTGKPYGVSAFNTEWRRTRARAGVPAKVFPFHDIKAKALSDSPSVQDAQERGDHVDERMARDVYRRKPSVVTPLPRVSGKKAG